MLDNNKERDITIYLCTFQVHVNKANVHIKFPCQYYLEWKTANAKKIVEGKTRPTANNSIVTFNQTLQLITQMIYDHTKSAFLKKETMLNLNLISKSRQDQVKLIGRVTIDLSQIANKQQYQQQKSYKLAYCSVDAQLTFSAALTYKKITNMNPQDLDKSSFNDYFSLYSSTSAPKDKFKRDLEKVQHEDTSIAFTRNTQQNVIDIPQNQHRSKPFNQTFFLLNSPVSNRNRQPTKPLELQRNFNRSDFAIRQDSRAKQIANSRSTQLTYGAMQPNIKGKAEQRLPQDSHIWQRQKVKVRGQIDGNRQKIQELQRKIQELCYNLEDSKRHLQITQRQNKQKEDLIKSLRQAQSNIQSTKKKELFNEGKYIKENQQLQAKVQKASHQRENQQKQWKSKEEMYRSQINQLQTGTELHRRETDDLRKMWNQKKDHYQQKIRGYQAKNKQKQQKINEMSFKMEELLKFKYQYQILKEVHEEKEDKLKSAERSLNHLKSQIQQINKNNYGEEIYKLKIQLSQQTKNCDDLKAKYIKSQQQINKHKQNYIKLQTAFQIQSKNYDNSKQKSIQQQSIILQLRQDQLLFQSNLAQSNKKVQELSQQATIINANNSNLEKQLQEISKLNGKASYQLQAANLQRQHYRVLAQKAKQQKQLACKQFDQKIQRIESNHKQKQHILQTQKYRLEQSIGQLATANNHLQSTINKLQSNLSQLASSSQSELAKKEAIISSLESTIADKQQLIKMYHRQTQTSKQINAQLQNVVAHMKHKETQLQKNIIILEEEANKILYILQQKEKLDKDMEQLQNKYHYVIQQQQQNLMTIERHQSAIEEYTRTIQHKNNTIDSLKQEIYMKNQQIAKISHECNLLKTALDEVQQQLGYQKQQIAKLHEQLKEMNDGYEQQVKLQEKYEAQVSALRQQKQQLQVAINKNSNQFARYNQQLQQRVQGLQKDIQHLSSQTSTIEEEKNIVQAKYSHLLLEHQHIQAQLQQVQIILNQSETQINEMSNELQAKSEIIQNITKLNDDIKQASHILSLEINTLKEELQAQKNQKDELRQGLQLQTHSLKLIEKEKQNLNDNLDQLRQQIHHIEQQNKKESYNQLIQVDEQFQVHAANSILEERRVNDAQQLAQQLIEKDQEIKVLQNQVQQLKLQIRNLIYQAQKKQPIYQDFTSFQKQQMAKIIDEQRRQIDRLQNQIKTNANRNSAKLQSRVRQLQANIVQLQSSFRMEIQRIIASQPNKYEEAGLSVISEEPNEDDGLRSQKSINLATPNRLKLQIDQFQFNQLKQKVGVLQTQKLNLQNQLQICEQQKFDLMSSMNQKQIQLQQIHRTKMILQQQLEGLKSIYQAAHTKLATYQGQLQFLRNQVNFGTSIMLPNEHSLTRSQPIINNSYVNQIQSKDIQIENLRVELQKYKCKEEELLWNNKDLQMQLETVTNNLNALNTNQTNFLLFNTLSESQNTQNVLYNKEKLMQSLRRNQQLKEMAYEIIRSLRQQKHETQLNVDEYNIIKNGLNGY